MLFVAFSPMVDSFLVGFTVSGCELTASQACGLDYGMVPPASEFPSTRNLKCKHWPNSSSYANLSALWVMVSLNPSPMR